MNPLTIATESADPDTLHRLATGSLNEDVLLAVAKNPATRWDTLDILSHGKETLVLDAVSQRFKQLWEVPTPEAIREIVQSAPKSRLVCVYLLFNPNTPPDILMQVLRVAPHAKFEVIRHRNVTLDILVSLLENNPTNDLIHQRIEEIGLLGLMT